MKEAYIFWRLADYFISEKGYRIIQLFENQKELWLEKLEDKSVPVIRLLHHDFDWGNSMQRDIEFAALNGESIRNQIRRRKLQVLNIYVSKNPPVDEYEFRLKQPFINPEGKKTSVTSILFSNGEYENSFQQVSSWLDKGISFLVEEDYSEDIVEKVKTGALEHAVKRVRAEKQLFRNGKPIITYVLMAIQILVFFFLELNGGSTNNSTLVKYGAKVNYLIVEGEWWRFLTPVFIHIGFTHLAMNTLMLYFLGNSVERMFGNIRFIFIYLFAGITGVIASFIVSPVLSAGASGAIFGCFGALLYFGAIYPKLFLRTMGMMVLIILSVNFAADFSITGIDNAGHLGGLAGGFLAAGIVHFPKKKRLILQAVFLILSAAIITGSLFYGFKTQANGLDEQSALITVQYYLDQNNYDKAYNLIHSFEKNSKHPSMRTYLMLGFIEYKKNMNVEAKFHLTKVIKMAPEMSEAYYYLAIINYNEGNLEKAKDNAKKAADLNPKDMDYQNLVRAINNQL